MSLPSDVRRCGNETCTLKEKCKRWVYRKSGNVHEFKPSPRIGCKHIILTEKQEIIQKNRTSTMKILFINECEQCMDEYAKSTAIAFANWMSRTPHVTKSNIPIDEHYKRFKSEIEEYNESTKI